MAKISQDRAFVRAVDDQITGNHSDERVIFIDHDNRIREAIYAPEFKNGRLQAERDRLEKEGVLKGIVHVSAAVLGGDRTLAGPRYSTVEYLPNGQTYVRSHIVRPAVWITQQEVIQVAIEATQAAFKREEDSDEEDTTDEP